jgi:PilZ domain-containing protein
MGMFDRLVSRNKKVRSPRLGARVSMELRVNVRLARDGAVHSVLLEDISTGGAKISTPLRLSRSDVLTLVFDAPRNERLEMICRIISIRPRPGELHLDYGLKFVSLKPEIADAVRRLVARRQQLQSPGVAAFTNARAQ